MIYILALHGVATGGPEACHQLSDALLMQGFDARMVYFRWDDFAQGMPAEFPERAGFAPEYERYQVKLARALPDEEGAIIVLPETCLALTPAFRKAKVLIWWLSVDNAFSALSSLNLNYLRAPNVFHACQSRYAERFIEALQFKSLGMLSDYTVDLTEYATPLPMAERPKVVAFNTRPDKVVANLGAIVDAIHALDPDIRMVAVHGLSRPEVAAAFAAARVYVDLGNFPGKDRLPREAASMGCPSIGTAGNGAAGEAVSYAMLFGDVAQTVVSQVNHRTPWTPGDVASAERALFYTEVNDVFSQLI